MAVLERPLLLMESGPLAYMALFPGTSLRASVHGHACDTGGWTKDGRGLQIVWMTKAIMSEACVELISCNLNSQACRFRKTSRHACQSVDVTWKACILYDHC